MRGIARAPYESQRFRAFKAAVHSTIHRGSKHPRTHTPRKHSHYGEQEEREVRKVCKEIIEGHERQERTEQVREEQVSEERNIEEHVSEDWQDGLLLRRNQV